MKRIQILVAEPDPVISSGVSVLLQAREFQVELFSTAQGLISHVLRSPTEDFRGRCVLMNASQNDIDSAQGLKQLRRIEPQLRVIFYSDHATPEKVIGAWRDGAAMFLMYPFSLRDLALVIENSLRVNTDGEIDPHRAIEVRDKFEGLTRREREVLTLVARGLKNLDIAQNLQISLPTVKMHRSNLMRKLGLTSPAQAVNFHHECQRLR